MNKVKLENFKTIFFDMDGTILNSEPIHMQSIQQFLNSQGIKRTLQSLEAEFYGLDDTAVYNKLKKNYQIPYSCDEFLKIKNRLYIAKLKKLKINELKKLITPGFIDFFKQIKKTHKVGVVSASEQEVVEATLNELGILNDVDTIEFRRDQIPSKPSPLPYITAMHRIKSSPQETLIFEDSPTGLNAARKSGATVIQITCFSSQKPTSGHHSINNFKLDQI